MVRDTPSEQEIYEAMLGRWDDSPGLEPIPAGVRARQAFAEKSRVMLRPIWGDIVDQLCDAEMIDVVYFTVFPNFNPFGLLNPIVYLFRPFGDDHTKSVLELMLVTPVPPGVERPRPATLRWLKDDEDFTAVEELGTLGAFVSQDIVNMGEIMKGLRNNQRGQVVFAKNYEVKIRHFYSVWQRVMGLSNPLEK